MISETSNKPSWLEQHYRILTPYVEFPESFPSTDMPCLFSVRENAPLEIRRLAAAYACYHCFDEKCCLDIKDHHVIGVKNHVHVDGFSEEDDDTLREEGKLLWKLIQRGDLPDDILKWGDFYIEAHRLADAAYPGWRDYDDEDD